MAVGDDINKSGDNANKKHDDISSSFELNMPFGDTLYLHPNDTGGSPIVTIKLNGTETYKMWSIVMIFALRTHNKIGFIEVSCKRDNKNPALANQWDIEPLPLVKAAFTVVSGEESHRNVTLLGPVSNNNGSADVHSNNVSSNNATASNSHVSLSNEQLARLMNFLNDNGVSTVKVNMAVKIVATARRNVKPLPESLHCYQSLNETVSQSQMTVS
nr:hypothetical protein [Tanacetum cinerariifolium]